MTLILSRIRLVFLFLLASPLNYGQTQFHFWNYDANDGLAQSFVYDIEQDSKGYLWMATGNGLSRFSGQEFLNYYEGQGLKENFCRLLQASPNGLYIAYYQSGIGFLQNGVVKNVNALDDERVVDLQKWKEQAIGLTASSKLFQLDHDSVHFIATTKLLGTPVHVSTNGDRIWIQTQAEIYNCVLQKDELKIVDQTPAPEAFSLTLYKGTPIWLVGNQVQGVNSPAYLNAINQWMLAHQIEPEYIEALQNELWIAHQDGITCYHPDRKAFRHYGKESGLNKHVNCVFKDGEKSVWFGTSGGGVFGLPTDHIEQIALQNLGEGQTVTALLNWKKNLWVGTTEGLVKMAYSDSTNTFKETTILELSEGINDIQNWGNDQLLIATNRGVYVWNELSGFSTIWKEELVAYYVNDLFIDQQQNVWVSTLLNGTFQVQPNGTIKNYTTANGLAHNNILKVVQGSDGSYWFATQGTALTQLTAQGEFNYFGVKDGLLHLDFTDLFVDETGCLWIATRGGGIYSYHNGVFLHFGTRLGLSSAFTYSVNLMAGRLMSNTSTSLASFDFTEGRFTNFGNNYLGVIEFSSACTAPIMLGNKEMLVFGSNKGLILLPTSEQYEQPPIYTSLTHFIVSGEEKDPVDHMQLKYDRYTLQFNFEGISIKSSNDLQFQYTLEGYDEQWLEPNVITTARYSGIGSGNYTFKVRVKGQDSEHTYRFPFSIATPFWKTSQFLIIGSAFLGLIVFLVIRYRVVALRRQKIYLEKEVLKRTSELRYKNKRLRQISYAISHDLKNPVVNIKGLSDMLHGFSDKSGEEREILNMLDESSDQLQNLIFQFIDLLKIKSNEEAIVEEVSFEVTFQDILKSISVIIEENNVVFNKLFEVPSVRYNPTNLRSILYNLISNSIKYKSPDRDPRIEIRTREANEQYIVMEVQDNGLGIDLDKHGQEMFGIFTRMHDHVEGSGVGLHMIQEVVHMNGGYINVDSEPDKGSTFSIYLKKD